MSNIKLFQIKPTEEGWMFQTWIDIRKYDLWFIGVDEYWTDDCIKTVCETLSNEECGKYTWIFDSDGSSNSKAIKIGRKIQEALGKKELSYL